MSSLLPRAKVPGNSASPLSIQVTRYPCRRTLAPQKYPKTTAAEFLRSQWQLQQREPTLWPPEMGFFSDQYYSQGQQPWYDFFFPFNIQFFLLFLLPLCHLPHLSGVLYVNQAGLKLVVFLPQSSEC